MAVWILRDEAAATLPEIHPAGIPDRWSEGRSKVENLESQLKTVHQTAQLRATLSKLRQDGGKPPAKKKPKSSRRSST